MQADFPGGLGLQRAVNLPLSSKDADAEIDLVLRESVMLKAHSGREWGRARPSPPRQRLDEVAGTPWMICCNSTPMAREAVPKALKPRSRL